MPVLSVFIVSHGNKLPPNPEMIALNAQSPEGIYMRLGDQLFQFNQMPPKPGRNAQVRRLQHKHDQNDVSNNQFIENPVLFNLVQRIKARQASKFIVTEQSERMMSSCLNQGPGRGVGRSLGRFELRSIGCHGR